MKKWALGLAAASVLAIGMACGSDSGDDDDSGAMGVPGGTSAESRAPRADGIAGEGSGGRTDEAQGSSQLDSKIIVNGTMALEAQDVAQAFTLAGRAARNAGGFVEASNLTTLRGGDGESEPHASITLRVPAGSYDAVIEQLRTVEGVEVLSEGITSDEVTEEYTDLQSRLRNLERTESQYLELLAQATTIEEILTVSDRLDGVRAQIEQTQGRINLLDSLTEYATIDVTIAPLTPAKGGGASGPGAVFEEAWDWSVEVAAVFGVGAVYLLVIAGWLAIPAAIAGAGWALVRRLRSAPTAA